ncbi:hypothetical protein JB92DRAFT_3032439 [Gautieria morchelliformis]|nr:hypothetical protein JB92DRAFT_3032439 [Gautieria morchelliformis]
MDQSNAPETPGSRRTHSAQSGGMTPPSDPVVEGDHDTAPSEDMPSGNTARPNTPPVPLLRPAQGAWDRAYGSGKPQAQTRSVPQSKDTPPQVANPSQPRGLDHQGASASPSAHTRSKDGSSKRREPGASATASGYPGQDHSSRVTHPESAQRHSQASGPVGSSSHNYNPPHEPREHYRNAVYARTAPSSTSGARGHSPAVAVPAPSPPYHPQDQPPGPPRPPYHEHTRASTAPSYPPPNYYPGAPPYGHPQAPPTSHNYPQHRPYSESDPYASASRNQNSAYPAMNYTQDHEDPAPVVFLLMEDIRFGGPEPDFQLAEVNVPLRPQVGEEGGWWADGEEVMKALQLTPSRLEGAAKVFARRGKYRQCFVRFSEDGTMECQPSNLMVSKEKTIELIIEPNLENRTPLREPYILQNPQHNSYPRNYASSPVVPTQARSAYDDYGHYSQPQSHTYPPQQYYMASNGKRTSGEVVSNSPGEDQPIAKRSKTEQSSSSSSKRPAHSRKPGSSQARPSAGGGGAMSGPSAVGGATQATTRLSSPEEVVQEPISPYGPFRRHELNPLPAKQPKEVVNAAIVAYLRSHIQNEEGYLEFAGSKGRLLPIPDLLKGYRFATRIVNTWANRKTPPTIENCPNKRITKNHVLQALFRQTSWGSDCEQTLQLAERYGPGGPRENSRVVEILSGGSMLPERTGDRGDKAPGRSQGSVALLDFLKDVDKENKARREEEQLKAMSSGGKEPNESGGLEGDIAGE